MRTTLDIDADVLEAAKELGRVEKKTAGQVLSQLARQALANAGRGADLTLTPGPGGFPMLAPAGRVITNDMINRLRDEIELEDLEVANALRRKRFTGAA